MIKGLMGNQGITVTAGDISTPYISNNSSNPMQGMIRIWGTEMQVFDGNSWIQLASSYATVSLDHETQDLLKWAKAQQEISLYRLELVRKNPALMKALENLKKAEDNFDTLAKFVEYDT